MQERIDLIKHDRRGAILWQEVRDLYIEKKNYNPAGKKSRALFAETINEIYLKNFKELYQHPIEHPPNNNQHPNIVYL